MNTLGGQSNQSGEQTDDKKGEGVSAETADNSNKSKKKSNTNVTRAGNEGTGVCLKVVPVRVRPAGGDQ